MIIFEDAKKKAFLQEAQIMKDPGRTAASQNGEDSLVDGTSGFSVF